MTKKQFKKRWESNENGGGINFDEVAECAKAWDIAATPKIRPIDEILYKVLLAAGMKDAEEFNPAALRAAGRKGA